MANYLIKPNAYKSRTLLMLPDARNRVWDLYLYLYLLFITIAASKPSLLDKLLKWLVRHIDPVMISPEDPYLKNKQDSETLLPTWARLSEDM